VNNMLTETTESITPLQFVMALRAKFPRFAEMQNGGYMQQDADECLRGILTSLSGCLKTASGGNRIDELFSYKLKSTMKCLECDEEAPTEQEDSERVMICHLGSATEPVSHLYQGVASSFKVHMEKNSPTLGRNAQYEKTSSISELPPYLIVQFARFGFKGANEWAGTEASKVKLTRNIKFSPTFDVFDMTTDDLKKKLSSARVKSKEQEDAKDEAERKKFMDDEKEKMKEITERSSSSAAAATAEEDVDMKPASAVGVEMVDTGTYELVGIISHKGRTADGGHYVGWTLLEKGFHNKGTKEKKDDQWVCYDDEAVTQWNWADITGTHIDLMGGRADTQIAYINIYKKVQVPIDIGEKLGDGKDGEGYPKDGDTEMKQA